jgi:deoxyribodipyrimidine photo-lyase
MRSFPDLRLRDANDAAVRPDGDYVLYWMTSSRRTRWSFPLQRARDWAVDLDKPLVVLEPLRCGYRWASDRLHAFVLAGMADNRRDLDDRPATYLPYVEPKAGAGKGLLEALAARACVVVGDDYPAFFLPRMLAAAGRAIDVRLELVDGNGLLPMRAADRAYPTAHGFRRFLHKALPDHLDALPEADPLDGAELPTAVDLPPGLRERWPAPPDALLAGDPDELARLPIDHEVAPSPVPGGRHAGVDQLDRFVSRRLADYGEGRNHPDEDASSQLSPYLHFGQLSAHEVFAAVADRQGWTPDRLADQPTGKRSGWWGMDQSAEAYLDELVTWREVGFNMCSQRDDYDQYESLPDWARTTLEIHAADERPALYSLDQLEAAATDDEVWNAAQRQLVREGRIHNYLRMLWGKNVLAWTEHPRQAIDYLIELNNKYALDGRDPSSYSGIFWVFGRYDRAWGPERPIYGKVRYMSSNNTVRKLKMQDYLEEFANY